MPVAIQAIQRLNLFGRKKSLWALFRYNQTIQRAMSNDIHPSKYPQARRDESIVDDLHGTKVHDPYRWLEDPDSKETKSFVAELNKISDPFLKEGGVCDKLKAKFTKLLDYEKYGSKTRQGSNYYTFYNKGLQNQSVLYQSKSYKEKGSVFLDVNKLSADGTTAISSYDWTEDGSMISFVLAEKGSDIGYAQFMKENGEKLSDTIKGIKFSGADWLSTNDGVIYATYPGLKTSTDKALVKEELNHTLYYHKLGTDSKDDIAIVDFPDRPKDSLDSGISEDGNFLVVSTSQSCGSKNRLYYADLKAIGHKISGRLQLHPLFTDNENRYDFVTNIGQYEALIVTNKDAPMCKLIKIKLSSGEKDPSTWKTIVEHDSKRRLECIIPFAKDKFLALYLEDVHHVLQIHDLETGKFIEKVPIQIGTISSVNARLKRSEVLFTFESFLEPPSNYRFDYSEKHDLNHLKIELVHQPKIPGYDPSEFRTEQVFYSSKDGTEVPMFITASKKVEMNYSNPTLLYGYGGFDVTLLPYFSTSRIYWMKAGGVYALANLRGGGEYGEKWHKFGTLDKKQNVFDDFAAAAEYLSKKGYSCREKLAIEGGSNGGLLVAACAQQRPDLFGAVIGHVGVLDMLRYHKFTIGHAWMADYGDPEKAEDFKFLYKYSPLHNIHVNQNHQWPATLMLTADHDDRVVPAHTLKYMAQLYHTIAHEAAEKQRNPLLAYIDVNCGHGGGKPVAKIIDELARVYSFIHRVLKFPYKE